MSRTHLVVVNDGHNLHSAIEYACETFPEDAIVAFYVDTAADEVVHLDGSETSVDDLLGAHRATAESAFDHARSVAAAHGVDVETVVAFGGLAAAVREYCRATPVDTVIVGCDDRDAFSSYLLGDDVTRVANSAPVPVVVV